MRTNTTKFTIALWVWVLLTALYANTLKAQVSAYTFSQTISSYVPLSGGTVLGNTSNNEQRFLDPALPAGSNTDNTGVGFPIGFNFAYNGIAFDRIGIHTNGWVSLGISSLATPVNMTSVSYATPLSSSSSISPYYLRSRIAAVGADLQAQAGSELSIATIGTAPNRVCVVQWTNYRRASQTGMNLNFQIRLNENGNTVEIVFGTMAFNAISSQADVGLGGFIAFDYNNRRTVSPHNWNATLAGIANTSKCTMLVTATAPVVGRTFVFTPPVCQVPFIFPVTDFTSNSATINFECAGCIGSYIIEYGPSDFTPGNGTVPGVGGTIVTTSSLSQVINGLDPLTFYDVYIRQDCGTSYSVNYNVQSFSTRPVNDDVCNALPLSPGLNGAYLHSYASVQVNEPFPPPTGCNVQDGWCPDDALQNTLWFTFTPSTSGLYNIDCYGFNTQAALYSAASCTAVLSGNATLLAANDNGSATQTQGSLLQSLCLASGQTYYLQVDGFAGAGGWLNIQTTFTGIPPAPTITCPGNMVQSAGFLSCQTYIEVPLPTVNSICNNYTLSNSYTLLPNASGNYEAGITVVTYTVNDGNNSSNCSFNITVTDPQPNTLSCQNATVLLNASGNGSITPLGVFAGFDGCSPSYSLNSVLPNSFTCANLGSNTVTLTATDSYGGTATCHATVLVTDAVAPLVTCHNTTITLNASGTASITATSVLSSFSDNCGAVLPVSISPNTFTCANIGANTATLTVADASGNTATCTAQIQVQDSTPPTVSCQPYTVALDIFGNASITPANVLGSTADNCGTVNPVSVLPNSFFCANVGSNTVVLTVADVSGNTATCAASVTVNYFSQPQPICQNQSVVLNGNGTYLLTTSEVFAGSTDNCGTVNPLSVSPNLLTCANIGSNTITLTATDVNGNTTSCTATVSVADIAAPLAQCQNASVYLGALGTATILPAMVNNNSTDNCGISSLSVLPNTFTCAGVGSHLVTLTVADASGNSSTCSAQVTVNDALPPSAICQNAVVELDITGNASIVPSLINNGSTDNCGISSQSIYPNTFTCAEIGSNTVVLTVADVAGNTASCSANVQVQYNFLPDEDCQNITVALNNSGNVSIVPSDVFVGNNDNCTGISPVSVFPNTFTCTNVGVNTVTLTVVNGSGTSSTCTANVTVADDIPPSAQCQNVAVTLNSSGNASISVAQINNGSTDNCGISSQSVLPNTFNCANVGSNLVTLTIADASGNSSTCAAQVSIADELPPTALCQNLTIDLDIEGQASITAAQVNNDSTDNCGISTLSVMPDTFTCAEIGSNTVVLTVADVAGNSASCSANVQVLFNFLPNEVCQNITVFLNNSGNAAILPLDVFIGNTDNCAGISPLSVVPNTFTCNNVGLNTVTLTVVNASGTTSSCASNVIVTDTLPPSAQCQNVAVTLNSSGNVVINAAQINNNSTDNCGISSQSVLPNTFSCANVGSNLVTLTIADASGNSSSCAAQVNIADELPPTALCQNLTIDLDIEGQASITVAQVNNGSSDNCGITSQSIFPNTFTCAEIGSNTVVLTVADEAGNTASCSANVQVQFNFLPNEVCQNIAVTLNNSGNAAILPLDVFIGNTDNCAGISPISVFPNTFTCTNIGVNTVTLTVVSGSGTTSSCTSNVIVTDTLPPSAQCQNVAVTLNSSGNVVINAAQINNGSTDNCGISSQSVLPNTFSCANVGSNLVTLTIADASGNSSTCAAQVSIADELPPTALCQNLTVELNEEAQASISAVQVNNSSTDNCGISQLSVLPNAFFCENVGSNTVVLTVADEAGNTATCSANVQVQLNFVPVNVCQNIDVFLNESGNTSVLPLAVFMGETDYCGAVLPVQVLPNTFSCANIGINTVTLTAANDLGNSTTCNALVSVYDVILPIAQCQNSSVSLNTLGIANLSPEQVNNNSTDNCGISQLSVFPNSFTCAEVGIQTVTLTVRDASGNSSTCLASIQVNDNEAPVALCKNASVNLDAINGTASITVDMVNDGSIDNCGIGNMNVLPNLLTCANAGNSTVTLTVTDVWGNTASCTSNIIANLPFNGDDYCKNQSVVLSTLGAVSILPDDVFTGIQPDACGFVTAASVSPNSFTCANVGVNTVTLTTVNSVGNTGTCSAQVLVSDETAPTIICPANVSSGNSPDVCGASVMIPLSVASDNCQLLSVINSISNTPNASGFYNTGTTTVVYTATDIHSNTATCSFTVTVADTQPPTLICPASTVFNSIACTQAVTWPPPETSDNCGLLQLSTDVEPGAIFGTGVTTVTYTAQDNAANTATCSFNITIADIAAPQISCPANVAQTTNVNTCNAQVTWAQPQVTDACSSASIVNSSHTSGSVFQLGTTVVSYTAADTWGNTATCSFTVTITDAQPPAVTCPANVNATTAANSCGATITIAPAIASDNCTLLSLVNNKNNTINASGLYATGISTVVYTATDAVGNTATCNFIVTVTDTQLPQLTCPGNITQTISSGSCFAIISVPQATATDNCGIATLGNSFTSGINASGAYLTGTTTVVYTATDIWGNTATCSFTVSVFDAIAPVIVACPANIVKPVVAGTCSATANWTAPIANDNCSTVTLTATALSGSTFSTGTTTVVYTATDVSGNTTTCSFTVTITDPNPPVITCPPNMVACNNTPFWPAPTYYDDCLTGGLSVNHPSGGYLPAGNNTITYIASDVSGNTASCSFTVSVNSPMTVILGTSNFGGFGVSCNGGSNGIINAVVIGGTPPYSYLWSNGSSSSFMGGLAAGLYTLSITDAVGCTATGTTNLTQPAPLNCSMSTTQASCANLANGSATVSVAGGGLFNYAWSGPNGPYNNVNHLTGLVPGVYTATVTNVNGCSCVASGTVNAPAITSELSGTITTTSGGTAPLLYNFSTITFTGGSAPYTFAWSTAGYVQYSTSASSVTVIYTNTSYWAVTISDNNPCTEGQLEFSSSPDIDGGVLSIVNAVITSDLGTSSGSISLTVFGASPCSGNTYHYTWAGPGNWTPLGSTNTPNLVGLPSGWYIVTVTDCGPDGIFNTGDEQTAFGYYWIAKATRGRGKTATLNSNEGLLQMVPNPITTEAELWYLIPSSDWVSVTLYDPLGKKATQLYEGFTEGGILQSLPFTTDATGIGGIYICKLVTSGGFTLQQRIVVIN